VAVLVVAARFWRLVPHRVGRSFTATLDAFACLFSLEPVTWHFLDVGPPQDGCADADGGERSSFVFESLLISSFANLLQICSNRS